MRLHLIFFILLTNSRLGGVQPHFFNLYYVYEIVHHISEDKKNHHFKWPKFV